MSEIIDKGYYKALNDALSRQKKRINKQWLGLYFFTCLIFVGMFSQKQGKVLIVQQIKDTCSCSESDSIECLNNQIIYYKKFYKPKK